MIKLEWATPNADKAIMKMARVSNPTNQNSENSRLLHYCMEHGHVSPFEMASVCLEINTTRDIARQILRHRSFSFQEFCISGDSMITLELPSGAASGKRSSYKRSIEHLFKLQQKGRLPSGVRVFDEETRTFVVRPIKEIFRTGIKPVFKITLSNGRSVTATKEHKFLTSDGFETLEQAVGLTMTGNRAAMSKKSVFACNGIPVYQDPDWLANAKNESISTGFGLSYIAEKAGTSTHTIRKWLKAHGLQFSKKEVSSYTPSWNKGVFGYSNPKHTKETIEKMRNSAKRGADSNLWRGGADRAERLKIADWCNANRSEFLMAANYKCPCGSSEKLELHHVQSVASAPHLAYEKENIQVLCKKCHKEVHKLSGEAKTWRQKSKGNSLTVHWSEVSKIEYVGEVMTYDMEVDHPSHNYVANGIVTHNSQRYADVNLLGDMVERECRMQDTKNRQNSLECDDGTLIDSWALDQQYLWQMAVEMYNRALASGIAKEQARALLPEGLTPSRLYMNGNIRSWIFYLKQRLDPTTQKEHRIIAQDVLATLRTVAPITMTAFFGDDNDQV